MKKENKKLGRNYTFGEPSEKHTVTLSLPEGLLEDFMSTLMTDSKSMALTVMIYKTLGKPMPEKLQERYIRQKDKPLSKKQKKKLRRESGNFGKVSQEEWNRIVNSYETNSKVTIKD